MRVLLLAGRMEWMVVGMWSGLCCGAGVGFGIGSDWAGLDRTGYVRMKGME